MTNEMEAPRELETAEVRRAEPAILIVDDTPANLTALEAILESLGARIVAASTGEDALKRVLAEDFAVILMDVQLPGMDGYEAVSLIKDREQSKNIPIIFLTAHSGNQSQVIKGYSTGAVDYLVKPYDPDVLRGKVSVFVELFHQREQIKAQAAQLMRHEREALRHQFERASRLEAEAQRRRIHSLFMQAPAAICIVRGPEHVFEIANARYCQLVGKRDLVGKPMLEAVPELRGQGFTELLARVMSTRIAHQGRETLWRLDRAGDGILEDAFFDFVYEPIRDDGEQAESVMVVATDVTEQVEARRKVEALAHQLEQAVRSRDEVMAIVSHDLRNPLSTITMGAALLERGATAGEAPSDRTVKHAAAIRRAATHMELLIRDLLDIASIDSGRLHIEPREHPAVDLLHEAAEAVRPAVKALTLELRVDPSLARAAVSCDKNRIVQVFSNLAGNAAKFTPPGGSITLGAEGDDNEVKFSVSDTGCGIPAEQLRHVFDRFWQARSDRRGLGLGLAIVKALVEAHGGRAWLESEVGAGTTVFFTVPRAPRP